MVTQRFWSSAIYLATSNSHASGIVGPRHDHMAIFHRHAVDKLRRTHISRGGHCGKPCPRRTQISRDGHCTQTDVWRRRIPSGWPDTGFATLNVQTSLWAAPYAKRIA